MTIERTLEELRGLLESRREAVEADMTEVPWVIIPAAAAQAILNAVNTLEGLRILKGIFKEDER